MLGYAYFLGLWVCYGANFREVLKSTEVYSHGAQQNLWFTQDDVGQQATNSFTGIQTNDVSFCSLSVTFRLQFLITGRGDIVRARVQLVVFLRVHECANSIALGTRG